MISICVPTRGRPEIFKQMCKSVLDTATNPDNVEFVIYRDSDDTSVYEYIGNYKLIEAPRDGWMALRLNECAKIATGPIYMFSADDIIFESKGWDVLVETEFEKYPDKLVLVCPDYEGRERMSFSVVGFLHKNWLDILGFMPTIDGSQSSDKWVGHVAAGAGRNITLKDMRVRNLNIRDEMHAMKNRRGLDEDWGIKFHSEELSQMRRAESMKLKQWLKI